MLHYLRTEIYSYAVRSSPWVAGRTRIHLQLDSITKRGPPNDMMGFSMLVSYIRYYAIQVVYDVGDTFTSDSN